MMDPNTANHAFEQLGQITRSLHQALRDLGYEQSLSQVAREIPDARDRLSYVGRMTEEAAHKVLAAVETGLPGCDSMRIQGAEAAKAMQAWAESGAGDAAARAAMAKCADFAHRSSAFATQQGELLTEIMMTQSFQDLSGQVIKKVIDIITLTEKQLLELLVETAPEQLRQAASTEELAGPQVPDKALKQDDVDDLLASLGF